MKADRLFQAYSTVTTYAVFQVSAKDIKQAVTKADNIIKQVDANAEITRIEAISQQLLDV
jgi:hypothetical protein